MTKLKQTWLEEQRPSERGRRSGRSKKRAGLEVAGRVMLRWHVLVTLPEMGTEQYDGKNHHVVLIKGLTGWD